MLIPGAGFSVHQLPIFPLKATPQILTIIVSHHVPEIKILIHFGGVQLLVVVGSARCRNLAKIK